MACMYLSPRCRARPQKPISVAPGMRSAALALVDTSTMDAVVVRSTSATVMDFGMRGRPDITFTVVRKNELCAAANSGTMDFLTSKPPGDGRERRLTIKFSDGPPHQQHAARMTCSSKTLDRRRPSTLCFSRPLQRLVRRLPRHWISRSWSSCWQTAQPQPAARLRKLCIPPGSPK